MSQLIDGLALQLGWVLNIDDDRMEDSVVVVTEETTLEALQSAAGVGDLTAQHEAGLLLFRRGQLEEAARYFQMAADQGAVKDQFNLALVQFQQTYHRTTAKAAKGDETTGSSICGYDTAFENAKAAADRGSCHAMYLLSHMYFHGFGVERDVVKSKSYILLASEKGNVDAKHTLAWNQKSGNMFPEEKNPAQGLQTLKDLADKGRAHSLFALGVWYEDGGDGVEADNVRAFRYYLLGADKGHIECQCNVATTLREGEPGIPKNEQRAAKYAHMAADRGSAHAQSMLGEFYQRGVGSGGKPNYALCKRYYQLAAAQNSAMALYNLGKMNERGDGEEAADIPQALQYFLRAKDAASAESEFDIVREASKQLGSMYATGMSGVKMDMDEAVKHYATAAKLGDKVAQFNMAKILCQSKSEENIAKGVYHCRLLAQKKKQEALVLLVQVIEEGHGSKEDTDICIHLLRQSSDGGNVDSTMKLAGLYYKGTPHMKRNHVESVHFFETAAALDNPFALLNLGKFHSHGMAGLVYDKRKAISYLERALEAGKAHGLPACVVPACRRLGTLYARGHEVEKDVDKAIELFQVAADLGDLESQFNLAKVCYINNMSLERAAHYCQLAADQGYIQADSWLLNAGSRAQDLEAKALLARIHYKRFLNDREQGKYEDAITNLEKAASCGNRDAQFEIGQLYASGKLKTDTNASSSQFEVAIDMEKSEHYFRLASEEGHVEATELLSLGPKGNKRQKV